MSENKVKLEWDGEMIKHHIEVPDIKFTPKALIDSLDQVDNQIEQMKQQKSQLESNLEKIKNDIQSAKVFRADRTKFEEKCVELCLEKLKKYISIEGPRLKEEAEKEAEKIISKDINAYTEDQKINQRYVIYQKKIATLPKVAEKIPNRLIRQYLYDTPIFDNPFR